MESRLTLNKTLKITEHERIDVYLREVEKDAYYPEGVKYAVNYRKIENGKWIVVLRVDNKEQQGPHMHFEGKIKPFEFISIEKTINFILEKRSGIR